MKTSDKIACRFIDFSQREELEKVSDTYEDVLAGNEKNSFKNKLVLVGGGEALDKKKCIGGYRSGVWIHADAINTIIQGRMIRYMGTDVMETGVMETVQFALMILMGLGGAFIRFQFAKWQADKSKIPAYVVMIGCLIITILICARQKDQLLMFILIGSLLSITGYRFAHLFIRSPKILVAIVISAYFIATVLIYIWFGLLMTTVYHISAFIVCYLITAKIKRKLF